MYAFYIYHKRIHFLFVFGALKRITSGLSHWGGILKGVSGPKTFSQHRIEGEWNKEENKISNRKIAGLCTFRAQMVCPF